MTLLELDRVTRRYRQGAHPRSRGAGERVVLCDVSLALDAGELVAIWGLRRCGRTTLLRVAAGLEPPDSGVVRFAGEDLAAGAGKALGGGIGYCLHPPWRGAGGSREGRGASVLEELALGALACGIPRPIARARAIAALERVNADDCAPHGLHELDGAESLRVAVARALVLGPALLVVDDPIRGVDLLERDAILGLLRSLADEGLAVLISATEATALAGADRALSLAAGELRGSTAPELASVVPLRRRASA
jgi:energy-coupling factor transporter ATP-binding protein EcfA2